MRREDRDRARRAEGYHQLTDSPPPGVRLAEALMGELAALTPAPVRSAAAVPVRAATGILGGLLAPRRPRRPRRLADGID